jgi:alkanesulfonate monooxygenase SsuD/methylene tetrahydromethanopterin reductase-like flavin-dependent oxidoreductase (luciferase family)
VEAGLHLPQLELAGGPLSLRRLLDAVDEARDCGFAAVSANDHLLYGAAWLDGLTALAAAVERSAEMQLMTTVSLPTLRGPVPLAKALTALHLLSGGRVVAGLGPGSSERDYAAVGVPFGERWRRFDESILAMRALMEGEKPQEAGTHYPFPADRLAPLPDPEGLIPIWIGSWGSPAGLRRVARLADGWLVSAYNSTVESFAADAAFLTAERTRLGYPPGTVPHAVVTMWTWITENAAEAEQVITDVLAPLLSRDPAVLRERLCVGPIERCADLLARFAAAGCRRVHFWPVADEPRQIELIAAALSGVA